MIFPFFVIFSILIKKKKSPISLHVLENSAHVFCISKNTLQAHKSIIALLAKKINKINCFFSHFSMQFTSFFQQHYIAFYRFLPIPLFFSFFIALFLHFSTKHSKICYLAKELLRSKIDASCPEDFLPYKAHFPHQFVRIPGQGLYRKVRRTFL